MSTTAELELRLAKVEQRLDALSQNAPRWVPLGEFCGRIGMSVTTIRRFVKKAEEHPADSPLKNGVHFMRVGLPAGGGPVGVRGGEIRVDPEKFCEAIGVACQ